MKTIFVVDDNNLSLLIAEEALSEQYNVITLASASAMFELLENVVPDLILLDVVMPEITGLDALRRLKSDTRYADIPVIYFTSKNDASTENLGFKMGIVDFISKPFSKTVLLERIKTHLAVEDIIRSGSDL